MYVEKTHGINLKKNYKKTALDKPWKIQERVRERESKKYIKNKCTFTSDFISATLNNRRE